MVEYCDGWMPIAGRDPIEPGIEDLWARADAAGRPRDSLSITIFGAPPKPDVLARYAAAGVNRAVFGLPPAGRDTVLPILDQYAGLIRQLG